MTKAEAGSLDHAAIMNVLGAVLEILGDHVNSCTELVVHDMTRPDSSIVGIVNGQVSGRLRNQSILAGPREDRGFEALIGASENTGSVSTRVMRNYVSHTRDGRGLDSSTVVVFDADGRPAGALCVNVDTDKIVQLRQQLNDFMSPAAPAESSEDVASSTIDGLIEEIVQDAIATSGVGVSRMSKAEKVAAVSAMNARGLFLIKGAVETVAQRLGTTKFTIYNYLDEIGAKRR
ncbi:putative transcriptional regulator YheO [Novosphingobium chloroacetimidivorans]|uniref:Putative transcriptional regulator YheO n=1 Tax=Novosphingobium chloroacetimidivorans TaxID=1428314 RepID=A0A7W7K909_9SPHN|nr:helix-turn-helix domain-containing protein [Novosphingobium chloroacetimidivorans]MBB4857949.1 putative transcriptional regulator YheO [Novosphingobium chloroacetimidivorans]